jgi:tRNA dimethylallyltransferase
MANLHIILGPTSTGKTSLALELAKKYNGVIVSADSRQIYKYMDIGTGKVPTSSGNGSKIVKADKKWVIDEIDVWGYDLANPNQYFSAYDYAKFAIVKINELTESADFKNVFLVGGTGFYIDIVTGKIKVDAVEPDFELRGELEAMTTEELCEKLTSLNQYAPTKIDTKNKVRLIRAIEKELAKTNQKLAKKVPEKLTQLKTSPLSYVGLTAPREVLYKNADEWLEKIWDNGLIDEVNWLLENGYEKSEKLNGLIYKSAIAHIKNEQNKDETEQKAKFDLHAYIRRQQTYFKKNKNVKWFDITVPNTTKQIENLLK